MHSLRSSGWTPLSQPSPRSCSSVLPVNSSHGRLKSMQRPSGPAIQIMTGAASAISRNRFSLSSSVGTGEADDVTLAEATGDPRELRGLEHPWHGSHPFPRPGVRDTDQALGGELAETGAVDPEVFDDTAKAALDLLIGLVGPGLEETGAEVGQERLEPQAFVEPVLVSLPSPALDEQAHDEQRLEPGHHAGRCDRPFIEVPDRRFAEAHDASGW